MESEWLALLSISGVIALGAMTPGQSFILVARVTMASSLREGIAAAAGMGVGCALFALIALLGLHTLLLAVPWLYTALKIAGGVYLLYLAMKMLLGSRSTAVASPSSEAPANVWRAFRLGLVTQISNPNTAVVFGSVFVAFLHQQIAGWMFLVLPALAFTIDFVWYALVACLLATPAPRAFYLSCRRGFDRTAGTVMALLGLKLILQR
ncbi:LysE family translocator [Nissabacter sp. SGAir0207]|uniref:LysE family translocator n=1 Tax=Nissabacter sp. SGAir0207 TaxID=2126321 RepID=UPI0010CCB569|nr:LysE family translocator [Nissabacter sp. SGAir0207]QCR36818.1 threonine transporter [Nissabacter sp. SGAir0207]